MIKKNLRVFIYFILFMEMVYLIREIFIGSNKFIDFLFRISFKFILCVGKIRKS